MRTFSLAIFLMVAVHSIASASTAYASPVAEDPARTDAQSGVQTAATRLEANEVRSQPAAERKPVRLEPQVLSTNFARPKPVQIYWFFGGR